MLHKEVNMKIICLVSPMGAGKDTILKEIKRSNKLGEPTTELCFCEEHDDVVWELKDEYKFKEVE